MWPDDMMPPQGMPPQGMPPQGMPPQGMPEPQAPKKPSLWERIQQGLMPVPEGYAGLLSATDVGSARKHGLLSMGAAMLEAGGPTFGPPVSFGQALGRGIQAGHSTFDNMLQNATKISSFAEEQRVARDERAKVQRIDTEREKVVTKAMQGADQSNPADIARRLNAVLPELLRIGDTKGYGALSGYLAANNALLNDKPKARDIRTVVTGTGPGAELIYYDNDTGEEVRREPLHLKIGADPNDRAERRLDAQNINAILDDYRSDAGKTIQLLTRIRPTIAADNYDRALNKHDAAAQISLLYGFVNLMDETAVREGEQAMVRQAGPMYEQAKGIIQRSVMGQAYSVPPTLLKQIYPVMKERVASFSDLVKSSRERAIERAKILGVGGIDRLIKPFESDTITGPLGPGQSMTMPGAAPTIRNYLKKP